MDWWTHLRAPFAEKAFGRLFAAFGVSRTGDFLYVTALVVVVLNRTGSAAWVAAALLLKLVPYVVAAPFTGVIADHFDRRLVIMVADAIRAALMVVACVAVAVDAPVTVLLLVAALAGLASAPAYSAFMASVPELVGPQRSAAANSLVTSIEYAGVVIGPALATLVLRVGMTSLPFAVNALTFLASAGLLAGIPRCSREGSSAVNCSTVTEVPPTSRNGLTALSDLLGSRRALGVVAVAVASQVTYAAEGVLLPFVSRDIVHIGTTSLGVLQASVGLGGVLGAALAARAAAGRRVDFMIVIAAIGCVIPPAILAVTSSPILACVLLLGEGVCSIVLDVCVLGVIQSVVAPDRLARLDGLTGALTMSAGAVATAVAPTLLATAGLRASLWIAASLGLLGVVPVLTFAVSGRRPTAAGAGPGDFKPLPA